MADEIKVLFNPTAGRFEATVDGHQSVCEFELAAGRMIFTHTMVPGELRGRGIAELLVRAALAEARRAGHRVVPRCSYVAKFIERHPDYQDLLDARPAGGATGG